MKLLGFKEVRNRRQVKKKGILNKLFQRNKAGGDYEKRQKELKKSVKVHMKDLKEDSKTCMEKTKKKSADLTRCQIMQKTSISNGIGTEEKRSKIR